MLFSPIIFYWWLFSPWTCLVLKRHAIKKHIFFASKNAVFDTRVTRGIQKKVERIFRQPPNFATWFMCTSHKFSAINGLKLSMGSTNWGAQILLPLAAMYIQVCGPNTHSGGCHPCSYYGNILSTSLARHRTKPKLYKLLYTIFLGQESDIDCRYCRCLISTPIYM